MKILGKLVPLMTVSCSLRPLVNEVKPRIASDQICSICSFYTPNMIDKPCMREVHLQDRYEALITSYDFNPINQCSATE